MLPNSRWLIKSPNLGNVSHKQGGIAETVKKCNGELRIKLSAILVAVTLVVKPWGKARWNAGMCQYLHSHRGPYVNPVECSVFSVVGVTVEHVSNLCRRSVTRVHILTLWVEYLANSTVQMYSERDTWRLRQAGVSGLCKKSAQMSNMAGFFKFCRLNSDMGKSVNA